MNENENSTVRAVCESCGKETWWNISTVFSVAMQEGKTLSPNTIRACSECGAVEGYDGPTNISS